MEDSMLVLISQACAIFAYLCIIFIYFGGSSFFKETKDTIEHTGSHFIERLTMFMTPFLFVVQVTGILMPFGFFKEYSLLSGTLIITGMLITVTTVALIFMVRHKYLGKQWGGIKIRQDHQIIDQGPYAVVRHPIYTLGIGLYIGLGLAFPVWWNLLACVMLIINYIIFAGYEDRFLSRKLPGYDQYRKKVPYRLIPYIW